MSGEDHSGSSNTSKSIGDCTYINIDQEVDQQGPCDSEPLILRGRRARSSHPNHVEPQRIGLRSYLLALSLAIILMVFWLLDSLKDPTFVLLVQGDLKRHQPYAKMFSVVGNIAILVLVEVISHEQDKNKHFRWLREWHDRFFHPSRSARTYDSNDAEQELPRLEDAEVLDPRHWNKMSISTERNYKDERSDGHAIPLAIFWVIGTVYILALLCIAYFLSGHPDLTLNTPSEQDPTIRNHVGWYIIGYLMYFIIESFGSISVVTFWSYADTNLTISMAKLSYGLIIATGQIGAIAGSSLATLERVSIPTKLIIACLGIGFQMALMKVYGHFYREPMQEEDVIPGTSFPTDKGPNHHENMDTMETLRTEDPFTTSSTEDIDIFTSLNKYMSGVLLILQHNYLLLILGVSCLHEVSLTCLDYEMKLMGLAKYDSRVSFTTFMGRYGQLTNILSFLLSYFAFPYLMKSYGVKLTLRIFPALLIAINLLTYIAMPENLTVLFVCLSLLKAMTYSINEPTHEILYIPTSNVIKFKAKFWIDVVGARIAKAVGSVINTYAGNLDRAIQYGSLPSIATALALFVACYTVGLDFETLTRHETSGYT